MKKIFSLLAILFLLAGLSGWDLFSDKDDDDPILLHTKFTNDASSGYTITSIQLEAMGEAGLTGTPTGNWGGNILTAGKTIAPGNFELFDLDIPDGHYSVYRLAVEDSTGMIVYLDEQAGADDILYGTITHWGSHDRTVSVTVQYNSYLEIIYISGYYDGAGID